MSGVPILFKELGPFQDVFIELVFRLAAQDKIVAGPVLTHESIQRRRLQTGDSSYNGFGEPVVHVFILLVILEALLEGFHPAGLCTTKEHIDVQANAKAASVAACIRAGEVIG